MGMQTAHDFSDNSGALDMTPIRSKAHLGHLEEDSALDRLQSIACVRKCAGVDDRIGIFEK